MAPFVQFKNMKDTHGGVLLLQPTTLLKLTLLYGSFSRFLNCTNGIQLRETSHFIDETYSTTRFKPFLANVLIFYPLKIPENQSI